MNEQFMLMIQNIINDDDLEDLSLKQFRSILIHTQDFLGASSNSNPEEEENSDDDKGLSIDALRSKYIL